MIAGGVPVLGIAVTLLGLTLLVRALVAAVRSDGYGQRPPPERRSSDIRQPF